MLIKNECIDFTDGKITDGTFYSISQKFDVNSSCFEKDSKVIWKYGSYLCCKFCTFKVQVPNQPELNSVWIHLLPVLHLAVNVLMNSKLVLQLFHPEVKFLYQPEFRHKFSKNPFIASFSLGSQCAYELITCCATFAFEVQVPNQP